MGATPGYQGKSGHERVSIRVFLKGKKSRVNITVKEELGELTWRGDRIGAGKRMGENWGVPWPQGKKKETKR